MNILSGNIEKITALCDQFHVRSPFAFGSVTDKSFRPDRDLDLVVDIRSDDPISYSDSYFGLKFQLEKLLKRHIDLLESKSIRNPFLKNKIDKTKVLIYGKGNKKNPVERRKRIPEMILIVTE